MLDPGSVKTFTVETVLLSSGRKIEESKTRARNSSFKLKSVDSKDVFFLRKQNKAIMYAPQFVYTANKKPIN